MTLLALLVFSLSVGNGLAARNGVLTGNGPDYCISGAAIEVESHGANIFFTIKTNKRNFSEWLFSQIRDIVLSTIDLRMEMRPLSRLFPRR